MAKQLNILPTGQVITTALHTEMQQSYLEYAMSVIVGRALPDVRDGLKPVHRRILYAMHELGLTPDRPYRKCARVVGDVLGKYHPHGDQSVYDALVRLVQDFSSRYPLLAGHGNFGSVDNDPPAAMRYTETRLAAIGNEGLLTDIGEATVDFVGNFDNSQQEPTVLPAQLPFLLLNGSSGIAVGMATNIPPHNLNEVVDGLVALIDRPTISDDDLLALIPGPDFPTGGEIIETSGIREAYLTGRGSVPVRGVTSMEEVNVGRGKHRRTAIIITELPYQVNKASLIEKIADLVNQGKLEGIGDIRDESDRDGIRVVIELRRDVNPHKILNYLYRQTALQSNFGVILLAIENGQPKQMTLRELLQGFLDFREVTLTRQYRHEFEQAEHQLHIVEGRLTALSNLDEVIDILRHAPDGSTAKLQLQERLDLSDRQADAILSMPLRRLTALEHQSLQTERDELATKMAELNKLLSDRRELLKALKKDLRSLKKQYGDDRRTRILTLKERSSDEPAAATAIQSAAAASPNFTLSFDFEEDVQETVVEITQRGYVRRMTPKSYERQNRNRNDDTATAGLEDGDDFATQTQFTTTKETLVVFTRSGKAYPIKVRDIPQATGKSKGAPLVTLLPAAAQGAPDAIAGAFILPETLDEQSVLLLTGQGRIKRLALSEFADLTGRGLTVLKLKEDDQLLGVSLVQLGEQVVLATSNGRVLRFEVMDEQVAIASRTAQGNMGMRVGKKETIVGWAIATKADTFLMVSQQGYAKKMAIGSLRRANTGELGTQVFQFENKTDMLAGIVAVLPEALVFLLTNENHLARIEVDAVEVSRKDDKSDRIVKLGKTERITNVSLPILYGSATDDAEE
ncbi:MAG: DNA topoisomerase (ATP-hydrolyzing) subunit A [Myxacorys californica WJT36-NPBG1]|jgi:DNA gyrase subunit A|nr:DNA topoisomerase (ATP-hydrolyzing) subunit A [Myxacorys californica WJT36-NPBG1]